MSERDGQGARFSRLWDEHAGRVYAYARRHTDPDSAQDVVAETFLVAWRRLEELPGDPLPWLLVVARNTVANRRRSTYRARVVQLELARLAPLVETAPGADVPTHVREQVLSALAALSAADREALFLTAWDGLDAAGAAEVAGCSVDAFYQRLSRARTRLAAAMDENEDDEPALEGERR